jgi:hypothetical protein
MKTAVILLLATGSCAFAQETTRPDVAYQSTGVATAMVAKGPGATVQGAPYSATITNKSMQTLADGNRIVQSNTGTTARDSQGRTRQDAMLPTIGNLSAADAPHLVFIVDPVLQVSYTLNLTDKTAQKVGMVSGSGNVAAGAAGPGGAARVFFSQQIADVPPLPVGPPPASVTVLRDKALSAEVQTQMSTEDLGTQTMEGLLVTGVRTTRTIPAGQIGNDKPISVVTEVWTSPDLKTIVYSKRSDPRMGEQTFKLTNIVRGEPDASLFTVPADFKIVQGPQNLIYRVHD